MGFYISWTFYLAIISKYITYNFKMSYDEYENEFYDHSLDNFETYDEYLD